jgi:membrane-associated phospholipid phosphatase
MRNLFFARTTLAILFVAVCAPVATGQSPYSLSPGRETILIGSGVAGSLAAYSLHDAVAPLTAEEVANLSRSDVNPFDRGATYQYSSTASQVSDWLVYVLIASPLALAASGPVRDEFATYGTMYGETLLLTLAAAQLTKGLIPRTRPYAYNPEAPSDDKTAADGRKSFYSSHTAFAFASAVFMSVTFQAYEPDSPWRPWIWAGSLAAATTVGVLRYTSGSHFPTDILVGAAIGALAGFAVPALHTIGNGDLTVAPAAEARRVQIAFSITF